MPLYECVLIARNDVTQQQVEGLADTIAAQFEPDGDQVTKREYWGLRTLAYRINKNRKGHYMLLGLDAKPASMNGDVAPAGAERGRAALPHHPRRRDRRGAERHPVAQIRRPRARLPRPEAGRTVDSGRKRGYDDREEFRARDGEPGGGERDGGFRDGGFRGLVEE